MSTKHRFLLCLLLFSFGSFLGLQIYLISPICFDVNHPEPKRKEGLRKLDSPKYLFPDIQRRDISELQKRKVPFVFHYVFCNRMKKNLFTFNHYLSVLSVWRNFEPDGIEIHVKGELTQDKYNTWLQDLQGMIPTLAIKKMPDYWKHDDDCSQSYGLAVLHDRGGVFISHDVILTKHSISHLETNFSLLLGGSDIVKAIFSTKSNDRLKDIKISKYSSLYIADNKNDTRVNKCNESLDFNYAHSHCFILESDILPKDLFNASLHWETFLYHLYRNDPEVVDHLLIRGNHNECSSVIRNATSIPRIVHYIWFHSVSFTFMMYLSINSTLHIVKPDKIFIHSDLHIRGEYWDMVKGHPKIVLVYRESPVSIFGKRIKYTTHGSDVARVDILNKYGGIYIDWDVIWTRSLDDILASSFHVVANYDHMVATLTFPFQLNMGVTLAVPRAKFIQKWQQGFKDYRTDDFYYNALELPYKIYERNPELVHVEKTLQVMCFRLKCHPIFDKNHRDWTRHQYFDWRKVYSLHFTYPDPHEFQSEATLLKSTGLFSEVGRNVLQQSGHSLSFEKGKV